MTGKSIKRMSGMSAKRVGKVATAGFVISIFNLLWMFFKWMCIGSWFCIKWICIGMAKFTKWTFKTGKKTILKIKERRSTTLEM